jgi:protein SCO1/2
VNRAAPLVLAFAVASLAARAWADPPADPGSLASVSPPPAARAPMDLAFEDQHGRSVTLAALAQGRPMLLVPVQHTCRNLCGYTLDTLRTTLAGLRVTPGADLTVVAFGFDPRETPADAAHSAARLGGADAPGVEALVGTAQADADVTGALGYRYTWVEATGQYAHLAAIAVLAPDGRLVRWLPGLGVDPAELSTALADARQGDAPGLADEIRLLCFHFDPTTGRYTLAIWRLLQWAAGATIVVLGGGIALALRRRRPRTGAAA